MQENSPSSSLRHPIGVVARKTGMKPDLIRAWERRYNAVEPGRTETRRRSYSDEDIERLLLLRRVVAASGRGIGQVAHLSNQELRALIAEGAARAQPAAGGAAVPEAPQDETAESWLALCLSAARRLDARDLEQQLERAAAALGRHNLLEQLLSPLMHQIGELWQSGELRPVHEHMASSVVRSFVGSLRTAHPVVSGAPQILVTTPARQLHELGALIAAASLTTDGWQVTYLGPNLPAEEIAEAAVRIRAKAVVLGIVYPHDDAILPDEIRRLRRQLPRTTELLVGGRAAASYSDVLEETGARRVESLRELREELDLLRSF